MTQHHFSDALLMSYALGKLPQAQRVLVRTHLALCPECREAASLSAECAGSLLDAETPVAMEDSALDRTLARLDLQDLPELPRKTPTTASDFATGHWKWVAPGIRMMRLMDRDEDDARLDLLRVAPGVGIPDHGHSGTELTCVLQGGFTDGGEDYRAGDVAEIEGDVEHRPVAMDLGEDCICLIATAGRLRASGRLVRLVHRMLDL